MSMRKDLVHGLLLACPSENAYLDFCAIAGALERGYGRGILSMPALSRWPATARWLRKRL